VHSKAGVAGGAGVASSSLLKKEVPSERFNLLIEALASSTDPRLFSVAGLTLGLGGLQHSSQTRTGVYIPN